MGETNMKMKSLTITENKADFVQIEDNTLIHKQIEFREGKRFMRLKKRVLIGTA